MRVVVPTRLRTCIDRYLPRGRRLASQPKESLSLMDLNDTPEQAEYRVHVRAWLEQHASEAPKITRDDIAPEVIAARRAWQRKLAEGGFVGITWPMEYGGQSLGPLEQVIFNQELS